MKDQVNEIINRNKGDVQDLILHLDQEIHLNSILAKSLKRGILKTISQEKGMQFQLLKTELQIGLIKYNNENDLNNDRI